MKEYGEIAIQANKLEAWPNNYSDRGYVVFLEIPEFTCKCPRSGFPDFATIKIEYIPDKKIVELKSLKLYINDFREKAVSHEDATNKILDDLVKLLKPRWMKVVGDFNVRGNIKTIVTAEHPKPNFPPPSRGRVRVEVTWISSTLPLIPSRQGREKEQLNKALVIFSGGQDSTTSLYWTKQKFDQVSAITFRYGQRHQIEIEAAKKIANLAGVTHKIVSLDYLQEFDNALINPAIAIDNGNGSLPNTFVPGRNILFITMAAIYAYKKDISDLVLGVCQTDYSGYPDCREEFIKSMGKSLSLGMERPLKIHTPLMRLSKAESIKLAQEVGAMEALALSRTCYEGIYPACGQCPACQLRLKGFSEAGLEDPIEYQTIKL